MLSIISCNTKIIIQKLDKFNEKLVENANLVEILEKRNHAFLEGLNTCQSIQDDKVKQDDEKIEKIKEQLESVNKYIECKHKELQKLMRIKEDR